MQNLDERTKTRQSVPQSPQLTQPAWKTRCGKLRLTVETASPCKPYRGLMRTRNPRLSQNPQLPQCRNLPALILVLGGAEKRPQRAEGKDCNHLLPPWRRRSKVQRCFKKDAAFPLFLCQDRPAFCLATEEHGRKKTGGPWETASADRAKRRVSLWEKKRTGSGQAKISYRGMLPTERGRKFSVRPACQAAYQSLPVANIQ
jgi:hypothetical protein